MKLYGIPNCSTVKKTRDWLALHGIEIEFRDFKKQGLDAHTAENWLEQRGFSELINRKGLTWRRLSEAQKLAVKDNATALCLMLDKPSVIKRPLLEKDGRLLHIGFDQAAYEKLFKPKDQP